MLGMQLSAKICHCSKKRRNEKNGSFLNLVVYTDEL
jgi:hypothetical protein